MESPGRAAEVTATSTAMAILLWLPPFGTRQFAVWQLRTLASVPRGTHTGAWRHNRSLVRTTRRQMARSAGTGDRTHGNAIPGVNNRQSPATHPCRPAVASASVSFHHVSARPSFLLLFPRHHPPRPSPRPLGRVDVCAKLRQRVFGSGWPCVSERLTISSRFISCPQHVGDAVRQQKKAGDPELRWVRDNVYSAVSR